MTFHVAHGPNAEDHLDLSNIQEPDGFPPGLPGNPLIENRKFDMADGSMKRLIRRTFRADAREFTGTIMPTDSSCFVSHHQLM